MIKKETIYIFTGGLNGNLSIVCGSQLAEETTTMNIPTTTASSTTRFSSPTTVVLSTEPISAFNITDANINTTAAPLSAEGICGHQIYAKCKYIHVYFLSGLRWHCSEAMDVGRQCVDVNIHSLAAKVNKKPNILKEKTPL